MKIYYLRFTSTEFTTKSGSVWRTDPIDLYQNSQYKNYSTVKSAYGLNLLGNGTFTGLKKGALSGGIQYVDTGYVQGGRYIDTSARIDLVSWQCNFESSLLDPVNFNLRVYTSDKSTSSFSTEWTQSDSFLPNDSFYLFDTNRYAIFELTISSQINLTLITGMEILVRVEIDNPIMGPMYSKTRRVLDRFPEWMTMREYAFDFPATPETATPQSLGGKLINAMAGEWLDDAIAQLNYNDLQQYISTVDLNQKAWAYESVQVEPTIWQVLGDGVALARVAYQGDFYGLTSTEDAYFYNEAAQILLSNKSYTTLTVNGTTLSQGARQLWNSLDDIGTSVDLFRLKLEDNATFQKRILDVYINRPGVGVDAFKKAIRRELNLWKYFGSTPDSFAVGATPNILEMKDIETHIDFFHYSGVPKKRMEDLVDYLSRKYPTTWGNFRWGNTFWDVGGVENKGYGFLPRRFDATPLSASDQDSGVGDGNDLYVFRPDAYTGPHQFNARLKVRGRQRVSRVEYPQIDLDVKLYAHGKQDIYQNPANTIWLTLEADINGTTYYTSFQMTSTRENSATPSSQSQTIFAWLQGSFTDLNVPWFNKTTGVQYGGATPSQIIVDIIQTLRLRTGRWNVGLGSYTNVPTDSTLRVWYSDDLSVSPTKFLGLSGISSPNYLTISNFNLQGRRPLIVFESQITNPVTVDWYSPAYTYHVTLNGVLPDNTQSNFVLTVPPILSNAFTTDVYNRDLIVSLETTDGATYGGYVTGSGATPNFLTNTYISLNGSTTWTGGRTRSLATNTTTLTFASSTGGAYPTTSTRWQLFESNATSNILGTVDENGPWREGQPPIQGNTNYTWKYVTVNRNNFNILHNTDYVITWMGVESVDDANVIVWLDTNTVKPYVDDGSSGNITYPDNAIKEVYDGNFYGFSTFAIKARLRPGFKEQWYPKLHSGYFYDSSDEYYLYASRLEELAAGSTPAVLQKLARLGAPIHVQTDGNATPNELRQVAFFDDATPQLSLIGKEQVKGTGTTHLYASYNDIYNISITDLNTGAPIGAQNSTATNVIYTTFPTIKNHTYELTYIVTKSFYADNDYIHTDNTQRTKLVFDKPPTSYGAPRYRVNYEASVFDPATPVGVPLNTFYTTFDEGFLFIDHDEQSLSKVEVRISPSKIMGDGLDYALITIRSLDQFGNPKPYQGFTVTTTIGTLSASTVKTDRDGFVALMLTGLTVSATPISGIITVSGAVSATVSFELQPVPTGGYRLVAMPTSDSMPADNVSRMFVVGRVETTNYAPVPYAVVYWKKDRYLFNLFNRARSSNTATPGQSGVAGYVVADSEGRFNIGPFIAATPYQPGYWLVSAETQSASPNISGTDFTQVGDVVYWYEYPDTTYGVENISLLPRPPAQKASPAWTIPTYTLGSAFPVRYDERQEEAGRNTGIVQWKPPAWYAIDRYTQYQMGLLGDDYYTVNSATPPYPSYKEV